MQHEQPQTHGFTQIPAAVHPLLFGGPASGIPACVYVSLLTFVNRSGTCWPSLESIAHRAGFSRMTVKRALATLRELGLITVEAKAGRPNVYYLPHVRGNVGTPSPTANEHPDHTEPPQVSNPAHTEPGVDHTEPGVDHTEPGVDHTEPRTISKNQTQRTTPKNQSKSAREADDGQSTDPVDEQFQQFWERYPRKTAKGAAHKAWRKLALRLYAEPEFFRQIMRSLEQHVVCDQWVRDDGRFIPHASTWLNQERWEDEPPPARHPTARTGPSPTRPAGNAETTDRLQRRIAELQARGAGLPATRASPDQSPSPHAPHRETDVLDAEWRVTEAEQRNDHEPVRFP